MVRFTISFHNTAGVLDTRHYDYSGDGSDGMPGAHFLAAVLSMVSDGPVNAGDSFTVTIHDVPQED